MMKSVVGISNSQGMRMPKLPRPVREQSSMPDVLGSPKSPAVVDSWVTMPSSATVRTMASNIADKVMSTVVAVLPVVAAAVPATAATLQGAGTQLWQVLKDSYGSKPTERKPLPGASGQTKLKLDDEWEYLEDVPSLHPGTPPIIGDDV